MKFKYTEKGNPFIEIDDNNSLYFSTTTSNDKGYKWMLFSGMSTTTVALSSGKGKKKVKSSVKIDEPISLMLNMKFSGAAKSAKSSNVYLTKKYLAGLKRLFEPYLTKDGLFPYKNLKKFEECINNDIHEIEDMMEEDPNGYYEEEDDETDYE